MDMMIRVAAVALLALPAVGAAEVEVLEENPVSFFVGAGLSVGGDDLVEVEFEDDSTEELEAGGLIDLKAGVIYRHPEKPYSVQASFGYFFDSVNAENGDVSFSRMPIELLGFYHIEKHRIGGGLTYHLSPELDFDLIIDAEIKFDNALGLVAEYGYQVSPNFIAGVRGGFIDYQVENGGSDDTVTGNHVGLYGLLVF